MLLKTRSTTIPYNCLNLHKLTSRRIQASSSNLSCISSASKEKQTRKFLGNQRLQSLNTALELQYLTKKPGMAVYSSVDPGPSLPVDPSHGSWKLWVLGMVISVILPFWRNKWLPFLQFKDRVESIVEKTEEVVEVVEKVADDVEKVAEEVADHLPEGGKLQKVVTAVENVAKETAKDAHLAGDVLEKVEELEKDVESFVELGNNETKNEAKDQQQP